MTTLGIIIGVSSVIILMSVGQGAVKGVIDELNALGTNLIFIEPGSSDESGQKGAAGSAITLTQASGLTLYNTADATTGNRTLAARGIATVYYMYGGNEAYISGSGLS